MTYQKECKICGKKFETVYPNKKYCSFRCRERGMLTMHYVTKKCKMCGKEFVGNRSKRYCSEECAVQGTQQNQKYRSQPCWTCQRATGYCDWSANLKPIKGWDAKLVNYKDGGYTYRIKSCPLYLPDKIRRKD